MLEKTRERIAKLEEDHESLRKAHAHLRKNGKTYLFVGGAFTAGYLLRGAKSPDVVQMFTNSTDNVATVINRSKNVEVVIQYLNQRGYVANPVQCLETLEKWGSQAEAAAAKGLTDSCLSQHLNGTRPHAGGLHFVRI